MSFMRVEMFKVNIDILNVYTQGSVLFIIVFVAKI
jgi:hypothetical protein